MIVIDNDPQQSSHSVVQEFSALSAIPVRYFCEATIGIAAARNRALREAADAEYVVFIDDDEIPEDGWLVELSDCASRCSADVVCGPVLPAFEAPAESWIMRGRFFERPRFKTGERIAASECRTGNVLLSRSILRAIGLDPFDGEFGITGGEDTHLFLRLEQLGAKMVWCDTAAVSEFVPHCRCNATWLFKRAFSGGSNYARCEISLGIRSRAGRIARSLAKVALASAWLIPAWFQGKHGRVRSVRAIAVGVGAVCGALGGKYGHYERAELSPRVPTKDTAAQVLPRAESQCE